MKSLTISRIHRSEVVLVGSGVAGLTVALGASPLSTVLLTKGKLGSASSSQLAQGGIAVAWGEDDAPELHASDTLSVGGGLSNRTAVKIITGDGPDILKNLIRLGAQFDQEENGDLRLGREAAHSRRRIVHSNGDATGAAIVRALVQSVVQSPSVQIEEDCFALELLLDSGRVIGVLARQQDGSCSAYLAPATVLATGGIGSLYSSSTNPVESTGDGLAMAARAGARLVDLEFMQFHPTALAVGFSPMPLLTEALRGEGAVLIDSAESRFMTAEHADAELAPRDVVSRAIWQRIQAGERVYLDAREAVGEAFPRRFPTVFQACLDFGLDPRVEPMPVTPAAHYHIGGVASDMEGRSSVPGLWVCGETAATQVHGANRLASNSLLEAMVFGRRVAQSLRGDWRPRKQGRLLSTETSRPRVLVSDRGLKERVRRIMWNHVGLVRNCAGLRQALDALDSLSSAMGSDELRNMLTVGRLVAYAALTREESRGVHFRSDFPQPQKAWERHIFLTESDTVAGETVAQAY